jgi:hypothetical protein
MLAKFSNFSKCHSCKPKIVPELLIPVNNINKILVILWIDLVIKPPHYEIWLKKGNDMVNFIVYNAYKVKKVIDYTLNTYLNKHLFRLILIIQKNERINILSVPSNNLNFPPSSGSKKGSHEWHFDHFINIFWVKRTFNPISTRGSRLCPPHYFLSTQLSVASYDPVRCFQTFRNSYSLNPFFEKNIVSSCLSPLSFRTKGYKAQFLLISGSSKLLVPLLCFAELVYRLFGYCELLLPL